MRVENHLLENSRIISNLKDFLVRTVNDIKGLVKHLSIEACDLGLGLIIQKDQTQQGLDYPCELANIN